MNHKNQRKETENEAGSSIAVMENWESIRATGATPLLECHDCGRICSSADESEPVCTCGSSNLKKDQALTLELVSGADSSGNVQRFQVRIRRSAAPGLILALKEIFQDAFGLQIIMHSSGDTMMITPDLFDDE